MFRTHDHLGSDLEDVLTCLPDAFRVVAAGDDRVVVGPTGAFVVGDGGGNVPAAGARVAGIAERCRAILAVRLTWAPFVDALVVADRRVDHPAAASVVPGRILLDTLLHGPLLLDDERVARIHGILVELQPELPR